MTPAVVRAYDAPMQWQAPLDSVGIDDVVRLLWRRKLALLGAAFLGLLMGLGASLWTTPKYRARTAVQLEGLNREGLLREVSPVSPFANATPENYVRNQVKILGGDALAHRVAVKMGIELPRPTWLSSRVEELRKLAGLAPHRPLTTEEYGILSVQRRLTVATSLNSQVLEIFFDATDPQTAAKGANLVVSEFLAMNLEQRWQRVRDTTDWLSKQTAELKVKLANASQALQNYAAASGLVFPGTGSETLAAQRMAQLEGALGKAMSDRAAKAAAYDAAAANPKVIADASELGPLRAYETQLETLRSQLADLRTVYTPSHQKVKRIEAQIAAVEDAIARERKDTLSKLHTQLVAATTFQRQVSQLHAEQLKRLQAQATHEAQYNLLKREVEATQALYDSMLQRVQEAGMAAALHSTNILVIDTARPPVAPYSPNIPLNLAVGLAFGLVGGVAIVLMRERSDLVRRPGDTIELNVPELGAIPSAKQNRDYGPRRILPFNSSDGNRQLELVTWNQGGSLLSESFRATLASILFSTGSKNPATSSFDVPEGQIIVVTSVEPNEGKTTVGTNLGIALAETNRRVLLIDADLRRSRLHSVFDVCNDWGLASLLEGAEAEEEMSLNALARPTRIPHLWMVPSGPGVAAISNLLYSRRLAELLRRYRREFDLVLIDSPPLALYADARVLGRLSDGVVIVVRANRTSRQSLRAASLRLVQDQVPVLGTVLNDWIIDDANRRTYTSYYQSARQVAGQGSSSKRRGAGRQ